MIDSIKHRTMRSAALTVTQVMGSNGLRLVSNLILTRLLVPEAFGLMALTQIFIYGLQTFSDIGINASIIQNKRGDDPVFVNTAWSLQIMRGFVLWFGACLLAWPAVLIYDEPLLLTLLPVAALTVLFDGFKTSREAQANRHMQLGRVVTWELACQVVTIALTVALAWLLRSVWALAFGNALGTAVRVIVFHIALPGEKNRWHLDKGCAREIMSFGTFIFLSTICSFLINMSERAILGAYIDTALFGIFSIGLLIGTLPGLVVNNLAQKVLFPLYRLKPPAESAANRAAVFKARRMVSLASLVFLTTLAFCGIPLIEVMYDPRYALAGPMVMLFALRSIPNLASLGSQQVMLAAGDSRNFFYLQALSALIQVTVTFLAVRAYAIPGAILGPGVAMLLIYPLRAWFAHRYKAWDGVGELGFMAGAISLVGAACLMQADQIVHLLRLTKI